MAHLRDCRDYRRTVADLFAKFRLPLLDTGWSHLTSSDGVLQCDTSSLHRHRCDAMSTLRTTPMRVMAEDLGPVRLIAELQRKQPAEIVHEALREYFRAHREEFARIHAETHRFIARGDVEGLAAALRGDASGLAGRLAKRGRAQRTRETASA
jgi:hypothetical protein